MSLFNDWINFHNKPMPTLNFYKVLSALCAVGVVLGLAAEVLLSLGYFFPRMSGSSMTAGFGIAVGIGLLTAGAIYFYICGLAARIDAQPDLERASWPTGEGYQSLQQ